jgi:hypothetical protein
VIKKHQGSRRKMLKLSLLQRLGQSAAVDDKGLSPHRRRLSERHAYRRQ